MSKSSFYGIVVVVLVLAAGLVSVTAAKMEKQDYLSRALLLEARVNPGATSTATTTRGNNPDASTDNQGIHNPARKISPLKYVLITGEVKSITASSFVLTARRKDYTVTVSTTTSRIYDRVWAAMPFSSMAVGHKVKAYGTVSGMTIEARIVRDLSFPVHTRGATSTATSTP